MNRNQIFTVFTYLLSLLLVVACAAPPANKSGIDDRQESYPRSRFLTASGQGDTAAGAERRARLNLATTFSVRITSDQRSTRELYSRGSGADQQVEVSASQLDNIRQQTDQLIEGVETTSQQTSEGKYTALAILEKTPAANRLRQVINDLDEQTRALLSTAAKSDAIEQTAANYQAWQAQLLAKNRRNQLAIITGSTAPDSQWRVSKLRDSVINSIRQLNFSTEFQNLEPEHVQLIEAALGKAGFERLHSQAPEYRLVIDGDIQQPFERDKWHWQTASLRFTIEDTDSSRERGGWLWNFKESATQPSLLEGRMNKAIAQKIENESLDELLRLANKTLEQ